LDGQVDTNNWPATAEDRFWGWAAEFKVRRKAPKTKVRLTRQEYLAEQAQQVAAKICQWQTKVKRAETWIGKYQRKLARLEKELAAMRPPSMPGIV